jgi:hypothetical protein
MATRKMLAKALTHFHCELCGQVEKRYSMHSFTAHGRELDDLGAKETI